MKTKLSSQAKSLLISFSTYGFLYPIITTFTNAFIWRERQDLGSLLLFYLPAYIVIPIAFWLNGLILYKLHIKWLYALGLVFMALGNVLLVFIYQINNLTIILLGLVWGFSLGLYWANRNVLTQELTTDENRNYFTGIENSSQIIIAIVVPIIIGWAIELSTRTQISDYSASYKITAIIAVILSLIAGFFIIKMKFQDHNPGTLFLKNISPNWNKARITFVMNGIMSGIMLVFPNFLILSLKGQEGSLGTLDSLLAVCSAIAVYFVGRYTTAPKRYKIFNSSIVLEVLGLIIFYYFFGPIGATLYIVINGVRGKILWVVYNPAIMKYIDEQNELAGKTETRYALISDREVFLNLGRILSIVGLALLNNSQMVPQLTPLMMFGALIVLVKFCR